MISSGVSQDLPLYLKTVYTKSNPPGPPNRPLKSLKPILTQGVSSESPVFFHINHVGVLSSTQRNLEISPSHTMRDRFLSNLKMNNIMMKPRDIYTDTQGCQFDYDSLKPSNIIDFIADKRPGLKDSTEFRKEFKKNLTSGFGKLRGQCTVDAMQPSVKRYQPDQLKYLQMKIRDNLKAGKLIKTLRKEVAGESDLKTSITPVLKKKFNKRKTSTPCNLDEIDEFEKNKLGFYNNHQTRKIYEL